MKQIPITQGQVALVDDEDYERVSKYKWQAGWRPNICSWYAVADGNLYLHRFIMDAKADEQIGFFWQHVRLSKGKSNRLWRR